MAAVTVASVIVLFFLPLGVIGKPAGQPYYDYLQFVLQYPRTVNPISKLDKVFTIHGLWPSNYSGCPVVDCGPEWSPENLSALLNKSGLRDELLHSWPNVETPNNSDWFWSYEYNKHGTCTCTCTKLIFTEPQAYFKKADDLYRTPPLDNLFTRIGIPAGELVDTRTFKNRVKKAIGGIPRLRCSQTNGTLLQEVAICYNKTATNVTDCRKKKPNVTDCHSKVGTFERTQNCRGNISYPTGIALGQRSVEAEAARRGPSYMVSIVLLFSLALGLIIYKYGPSYVKSKLA